MKLGEMAKYAESKADPEVKQLGPAPKQYEGCQVTIKRPGCGRHLVMIANDEGVIERRWMDEDGHLGAVEDDDWAPYHNGFGGLMGYD